METLNCAGFGCDGFALFKATILNHELIQRLVVVVMGAGVFVPQPQASQCLAGI